MINLRYPNINGRTEEEQLTQVKSYLHQLVQELNWVLNTIETANNKENKDSTGSMESKGG